MDAPRIVVTKSTVPVSTTGKVADAIRAEQQARGVAIPFEVVSNPTLAVLLEELWPPPNT